MIRTPLDDKNREAMQDLFSKLEKVVTGDLLVFFGGLSDGVDGLVKDLVEDLNKVKTKSKKISFVLTTSGGSLTPVQKMVQVFRHFYSEVDFIVPDYAYSAGTILCMSGDRILMNYFSNLGPIDPQVETKDGKYVSALGYLDKISGMLEKAKNKTLTEAEFLILKDFDLAELRFYEMSKELAIDLLKKWLANYKFKNWIHKSTGSPATLAEKEKRAEEIANVLSDSNKWKSHGRPISMQELLDLKLQIDDFDRNPSLSKALNEYYNCLTEYIRLHKYSTFIQTRLFL